MSDRIKVDPLTRIEGHLKAEYSTQNGVIENARIAGTMYRGFENFLIGRHPFDAVRITQRICGVCHEVHGAASCMAIEQLYGMTLPHNGVLLREFILGLSIISDHILHFYQLLLPDYVDFSFMTKSSGFVSRPDNAKLISVKEKNTELAENYRSAIKIRGLIGEALAAIGAKTPFCHALLPGGVTVKVTPDKLLKIRSVVNDVHLFLHQCMEHDAHLIADFFTDYFDKGVSYGRFISGGAFVLKGKPLYDAGVYSGGRISKLDTGKIGEDISRTFLNDDNIPQPDKKNAYSWVKTPAYGGKYYETGPMARAVVSGSERYADAVKKHGADYRRSSVMNRVLARMTESLDIAEYMIDVLGSYELNMSTINDPDLSLKLTGEGEAVSIASRGMLIHRLKTREGKIEKYDLIVPSTWNFGPGGKEPGVAEKALNGTSYGKEESGVVAGRVVRSFDPCLACAVH